MYFESFADASKITAANNITKIKEYIQRKLNITLNETETEDIASFSAKYYTSPQKFRKNEISFHELLRWRYFCGITLSTIGYGDIVPKTDAGKIFTIIFAAIGIPIHMLMVASVGCALCGPLHTMQRYFRRRVLKKADQADECRNMTPCIILGILLLLWLALGGFASSLTQNWTYVDGFYFAFVTLTTIGYGDYTMDARSLGSLAELINVYTVIGLILAAAVTDAIVTGLSNSKALKKEGKQNNQSDDDNNDVGISGDRGAGSVISSRATQPGWTLGCKSKVNAAEEMTEMREIKA
eukprot:gene16100-17721_t